MKNSKEEYVENLTPESIAKWACLAEAIKYASTGSIKLGLDPEKDITWIKPKAFENYIKERYPSMLVEVEHSINNGKTISLF